jgi:hypothetical protein
MRMPWLEPAYEAARTWAVQPISHPPPGWAQIVRRGVAAWAQAAPPPDAVSLSESHQALAELSPLTPLLTLVAAMIAEVCQ